jgi:hypothetical protein
MRNRINFYELIFIVLLLLCSTIAFVTALDFTPRGRAFPLIVIVILIVLLLLKLLTIVSPKMAAKVDIHGFAFPEHKEAEPCNIVLTDDKKKLVDQAKWPNELLMLFWLVFLLAFLYLIGFLPTIPLFLFMFLKYQGKHGWFVSSVTSLAVLVFTYVLFVVVLSVPFPEGLLLAE